MAEVMGIARSTATHHSRGYHRTVPELPEVETIANYLRRELTGRRVSSVWIGWSKIVDRPSPEQFHQRLTGAVLEGCERRGKFLVFPLSTGQCLILHLRMTGTPCIKHAAAGPDNHTHAVFVFGDDLSLHYRDVRKFGRFYLVDDSLEVLSNLGPEPLGEEFSVEWLTHQLSSRRAGIKPLLLDQRFVAGIGNIYADEALYRAGIHPRRLASDLIPSEAIRLHDGIRSVLREAVSAGGSTLQDFRSPRGETGEFQHRLSVFRRQGERCPRCGEQVERIRLQGRSTHFCPSCQPEGCPNDS
jgi:formamidopyrimidine-DNA glycosylase